VLDHIEYAAFGGFASQTGAANRGVYGYTGLRQDGDTGLVFADQRTLLVTTGRWMQEDPIGFEAGDGDLFRYAGNDPSNATDPSGLFFIAYNDVAKDYWVQRLHDEFQVTVAPVKLPSGMWYLQAGPGEADAISAMPEATGFEHNLKEALASPDKGLMGYQDGGILWLSDIPWLWTHPTPGDLYAIKNGKAATFWETVNSPGFRDLVGKGSDLALLGMGSEDLAAAKAAEELAVAAKAAEEAAAAASAQKAAAEAAAAAAKGLPPTTEASVADKLTRYLLNAEHQVGGAKAAWFKAALGFTRENAADLASQIKFSEAAATLTKVTEHGTTFEQVIKITGANGKNIDVMFVWIKNNDGVVRLVTAIPTPK
jgi:RHS repeat-associated protein